MSRPIVPCDCSSPAHCLEAAGGEQGLTADELELVRLRSEVARLRRLVTAAVDALDGLLTDVAALGFQVHPRVASHLHRMAHDLRAVLDQGEPR